MEQSELRYSDFYNHHGMVLDEMRRRWARLQGHDRSIVMDEHHRRNEAIATLFGTTGEVIDHHDNRFGELC